MRISNKKELNPVFRALYDQAGLLLDYGKEVVLELSEFKPKRNNEQNAYYWLFNGWVADFLNEAGLTYGEYEIPYTSEIIHDIQKKLFGVKTTTKMTVGEFCDYITKVMLFWQERTHGEFQVPELPLSYLSKKGYDLEYNLR